MNISWLKLDINILNDSKIRIIRKYPDGNSLFIMWVGLICLAMKSDITGFVYISLELPYTAQELAAEFDLEIKTVEMGLSVFKKLGMIDFTEGGMIEIVNFNKHQNIDKIEHRRIKNREYVKRFRDKQRKALQITYKGLSKDSVSIQNRLDKIRLDENREEKETLRHNGFKPPTTEEVQAYITEKKYSLNASSFIDFYTSKGWMVGKNKMKDWKAAVRGWSSRDGHNGGDSAKADAVVKEYERKKAEREERDAGSRV